MNFREERIEKLLHELRHEIERGLMEREISEEMNFSFLLSALEQNSGWPCLLRIPHAARSALEHARNDANIQGGEMTYQEILESISRHRADSLATANVVDLRRKFDEIEWALQALALKLSDEEAARPAPGEPPPPKILG